MLNCLVFGNSYFELHKKWYLQNFCLRKKWIMLEIVEMSASEIMTLPNNLILTCRFLDSNPVLSSQYDLWNIHFLLNFRLELWNTNHESLNGEPRFSNCNLSDPKNFFLIKEVDLPLPIMKLNNTDYLVQFNMTYFIGICKIQKFCRMKTWFS